MSLSRRTILKGAGALPLLAGHSGFAAFAQTAPARARRCRDSAGPVRAWQWRPRGAVDHHAVADGIQRRAARPDVRDQFHRSAGALRRHGRAAEPVLDRGPAPRTRRGDQGIEAPHRRVARGAGRQFARRQFDPQANQERRRRRCQPRRAVRRSQPRRLRLGRQARQRVQRPRPVPARAERGRERGDAGHRVPDACAATASTNLRRPMAASSASRARRPASPRKARR